MQANNDNSGVTPQVTERHALSFKQSVIDALKAMELED